MKHTHSILINTLANLEKKSLFGPVIFKLRFPSLHNMCMGLCRVDNFIFRIHDSEKQIIIRE